MTEQTTNRIMATVEKSGEMVDQIRYNSSVNQVNTLPDNITKNNTNMFYSCSFEDITVQWAVKVVKSITAVEQRVIALAEGKGLS